MVRKFKKEMLCYENGVLFHESVRDSGTLTMLLNHLNWRGSQRERRVKKVGWDRKGWVTQKVKVMTFGT